MCRAVGRPCAVGLSRLSNASCRHPDVHKSGSEGVCDGGDAKTHSITSVCVGGNELVDPV